MRRSSLNPDSLFALSAQVTNTSEADRGFVTRPEGAAGTPVWELKFAFTVLPAARASKTARVHIRIFSLPSRSFSFIKVFLLSVNLWNIPNPILFSSDHGDYPPYIKLWSTVFRLTKAKSVVNRA